MSNDGLRLWLDVDRPDRPRYFFDIRDGPEHVPDEIGEHLSRAIDARAAAAAILTEMLTPLSETQDRRDMAVDVRDERGTTIFSVRLSLSASIPP